jgi:predicted ArsR family transcriptional regulator
MVLEAARAEGQRLGAQAAPATDRAALVEVLRGNGYEPFEDPDGVIRLRNCPFDALAERHRQLTCSMNLAMLTSVAAAILESGVVAEPRPADGFCCVAFVPSA